MFENPTQSETGSAAHAFQYPKIYPNVKIVFSFPGRFYRAKENKWKSNHGPWSPRSWSPGNYDHGLEVIKVMVSELL